MRYLEFKESVDLAEGRRWQDTDDVKLLKSQIKSLDNEHAVNVYGPEVQITDAVKCIALVSPANLKTPSISLTITANLF